MAGQINSGRLGEQGGGARVSRAAGAERQEQQVVILINTISHNNNIEITTPMSPFNIFK